MPADLTAALAAVEAAWDNLRTADIRERDAYDCAQDALCAAAVGVVHALRAIRSSGAVVAVVSREAVEALRAVGCIPESRLYSVEGVVKLGRISELLALKETK